MAAPTWKREGLFRSGAFWWGGSLSSMTIDFERLGSKSRESAMLYHMGSDGVH